MWQPAEVRLTRRSFVGVPDADLDTAALLFEQAQQTNPNLFDGPVALSRGLRVTAEGIVDIDWAPSTYRSLALRQLGYRVSVLFVTVLVPTMDGDILTARAARHTAKAGRWQLPGGSVEPPRDDQSLDGAYLANEASRELAEETGIIRSPDDLTLWMVSRGENGSVGVGFIAAPASQAEIQDARAHIDQVEPRELDDVAAVPAIVDSEAEWVDYLAPYLQRYAASRR